MALVDMFSSITEDFWPTQKIVDHVSKGHPTLDALFRRAKAGGGDNIAFDIEYDLQQGGWRALNGQMTFTDKEIITKGYLGWRDVYVTVKMEKTDVYRNRHDPRAVANLFNTKVNNALRSMKNRYLAPAAFTAQTGNAWDSLADGISDSATYANIAVEDLPAWKCFTADGIYTAGSQDPISPTIENVSAVLKAHSEECNEQVDILVTDRAMWSVLKSQVLNMPSPQPIIGPEGAKIGFTKLWIDDVPVISDRWFAAAQCAAWNGSGTSRATCAGSQMMGIKWDYIDLVYLPEMFMKWNEDGWRSPYDYTVFLNDLHCTSNVVVRSRRNHLRIYGLNPLQDQSDWDNISDSQMNISAFAIPAEV